MSEVFTTLRPEGLGTYRVLWSEAGPSFEPTTAPSQGILAPGFVDIHIHGAFGVDFLTSQPGDLAKGFDRLADIGYDKLLPTTVTATPEVVQRFLDNLPEHPLVAGVHLEGPFISPKYPGAQPPSAIVPPPGGASAWDAILDDPRISVMTMAPELEGSLELIARLKKRGVRVGMGHTNATYAEAKAGFDAGASHTTHTYNAMRPLHHREAGTVGFALLEKDLATELIYDRIHVVQEAAQLLVNCKPPEMLVAVSDGTMAAGLEAGTCLNMWGLDVVVGPGDVRLLDGTLAGSAITLLEAFRNLATDFGVETAIRATSLNPRRLVGLSETPDAWLELSHGLHVSRLRVRSSGFR